MTEKMARINAEGRAGAVGFTGVRRRVRDRRLVDLLWRISSERFDAPPPTHGRFRAFQYGLSLYKRKGIVNQTGAIRITKSCDKPNRHDLGPGCKDLGGSRTRCAPVFRLKLVAGQPGPLSTKPSPSFGLAPGRLAEPAMRDFLIATINPIEMSKTESAKFTRRSRPELIAR
ncbi:MAG: hypothetical protein WA231_18595 [Methylocella sp.]